MTEWQFMAVINSETFNEGPPQCRMFRNEVAARRFVEAEHEHGWDYQKDEPKDGLFEDAAVFKILRDGNCELVQRYSTIANRDGDGEGWV